MKLLTLIDVQIQVPDDVAADEHQPEAGVVHYRLSGPSVVQVRKDVEVAAVALGYKMQHAPEASHLIRGCQRINIVVPDPLQLDITVENPETLPRAQADERGIVLGRLTLEVKSTRIVAQKERHAEKSTSWNGEWHVYGTSVQELSSEIHARLVQHGLHSTGVWSPPKDGIQRWHIEAYSPLQLVKVYIKDEGGYLDLNITLVDEGDGGDA